jgi:ATP-dependent exoDNAse (exonuclease V) alpha subunit
VLGKQIKNEFARAQFAEAVLTHPEAVRLSDKAAGPTTRYSTKTVLEAEPHVLRAAAGLVTNHRHQVGERICASVLGSKEFDGISREQARAFRHATGKEGLALIDGQAGTGKSFTMKAIRQAYEAQGYRVIGLAFTNKVAKAMSTAGFARAGTAHSELFALK